MSSSSTNREELRIALAMNGGVSLAVWMGGVTYEINQLRKGSGAWSSVIETMETDVRVDVIAGASAGGINGALLAAAMVFDRDLLPIRDLWVNKGSFKDLLRDPLDASLPSLLKGDTYFLPELQRAFRLLTGGTPVPQSQMPVELTLTTTSLTGRATTRPDDFGTHIADASHAEELTFKRDPDTPDSDDPFRWPDIVARLALAARCSASFPGAFEPSWCPVGESGDPDHPDMARHASFKQSRFLVDGGVLVNKPVGPALESIYAQRSDRQTRRVLAYVVPDPGDAGGPAPDKRATMPSPGRVVFDSLVSLPRVESIASALDHYRQHNADVRTRRSARDALVCNLTPTTIVNLAKTLFESYKVARRMSSCSYIADEVARGLNARVDDGYVRWDRDQLLEMLYCADLPWIPQSLDELRPRPGQPWSWGAFPIERVAGIVLDLVRRAYYVTPFSSPERAELGDVREKVHRLLAALRKRRTIERQIWRLPLTSKQLQARLDGPTPVDAVTEAVLRHCEGALAKPTNADWARLAARVRILFEDTGRILDRVLATGTVAAPTTPTPLNRPETEILRKWARLAAGDAEAVMARLLAFEVLETAFSQNDLNVNQVIEVLQVSAGAPGLIPAPIPCAAHLAGVQLGHFGGFYKRSWRANDWMWGRLDGTARLAQVMLDVRRIRQLATGRTGFRNDLACLVFGRPGPERTWLEDHAGATYKSELDALVDQAAALPTALPACTSALASRLQLEIAREELPLVAAAVREDCARGALTTGKAADFADAWTQAVTAAGSAAALPADRVLSLLEQCDIGAEVVYEDVGSDLFTATTSHALATAVSVANNTRSGLGPLGNLIRTIRAPVLLFWFLARNATAKSSSGPMVNALLLAVGATVVSLSIFVSDGLPVFLVGLGWVAVIAGLLLAATRSLLVIAVAAGLVAAALGTWTFALGNELPRASSEEEFPKVVSAVALVVMVVVLGSLRRPRGR